MTGGQAGMSDEIQRYQAVVAIVSVLGLASVWPAAPARAATPVPVLYGFGTNQFGVLGNGTTSTTPSLSPTPAAGLPGTIQVATAPKPPRECP
jgi:hypothetical protein